MHPEIVECNKPKDWEESADLRECFSFLWLLVGQWWRSLHHTGAVKNTEKEFSWQVPLFHCYFHWPTLPPSASPPAPDADPTDTTSSTIHGLSPLHAPTCWGFPLTHRGFASEQDFVSGQGFTHVTSILRFAHCQIWKEESGPLMKFSPLSPLEPLTLLSLKAIAVSAFQEKQQCCAKSADWQQVGIGFLC